MRVTAHYYVFPDGSSIVSTMSFEAEQVYEIPDFKSWKRYELIDEKVYERDPEPVAPQISSSPSDPLAIDAKNIINSI